jgi:hypothetical protein
MAFNLESWALNPDAALQADAVEWALKERLPHLLAPLVPQGGRS